MTGARKREFKFTLEELDEVYDENCPNRRKTVVQYTSGIVTIKGDDIRILVDDETQKYGTFESKDSFFNRLIKKIHNATK